VLDCLRAFDTLDHFDDNLILAFEDFVVLHECRKIDDFGKFTDHRFDRFDTHFVCFGCVNTEFLDVFVKSQEQLLDVDFFQEFSKNLREFQDALDDDSNNLRIFTFLAILCD